MKLQLLKDSKLLENNSYGDQSLELNIANAELAIKKVQYTERVFDRSRSQYTLKNLTCSNADHWLRVRQISAEMANKRTAYQEAKFNYLEKLVKVKIKRKKIAETEDDLQKNLMSIQADRLEYQACELLVKVEGGLKEIELLAEMHDQLVNIIGDVTEEKFELAQVQSHIKRAIMQSVREVRECGVIKCGNQEYLEQIGVSVTSARKAINDFLQQEDETNIMNTFLLHAFVDAFAKEYEGVAAQQAQWLGFNEFANKSLTYTPTKEEEK